MNLPRLLISLLACVPLIAAAQQNSFKGKVASVKETTWFITADTVSLKEAPIYNERVRTWNKNQQLLTSKEIRHRIEGLNDSGWIGEENCIYNKDNQFLERTYSYYYLRSHIIRKYDNYGRLIEESWQAKHWEGDSTWGHDEYIYNTAGKKIEVRGISSDNTYPRSIQYFGGSGRLDSAIAFGKESRPLISRTHYCYNAAGNEVERVHSDAAGFHCRWTNKYNEKGQKVEENSWQHVVYKYDDRGNEMEALKYSDNGNLKESVTKTYNDKGYLIKVVTAERNNFDKMEITEEMAYTDLDREGNPRLKTERRLCTWKPQTFVTVYEIRYYD